MHLRIQLLGVADALGVVSEAVAFVAAGAFVVLQTLR